MQGRAGQGKWIQRALVWANGTCLGTALTWAPHMTWRLLPAAAFPGAQLLAVEVELASDTPGDLSLQGSAGQPVRWHTRSNRVGQHQWP